MSNFGLIEDLKRQSYKKQTVPGSNMAHCFVPSVPNNLDFLEYFSAKLVHQIASGKKMSNFGLIEDLKRQYYQKKTVPGSNMARCFEPSVLDNLDFSEFLSKPKLLVPNPRRLFQTFFGFFLGVRCPCPKIKFQWHNFRLPVIPNHGIP